MRDGVGVVYSYFLLSGVKVPTSVVLFTAGFWIWTVERDPGQGWQLGYEAFFCLLMDKATRCLQKIKLVNQVITLLSGTIQKTWQHTNQQLGFDPFHGLILGYFLSPQFLIYHFLFQITLLQHAPFVDFHPDTQENKETPQMILT